MKLTLAHASAVYADKGAAANAQFVDGVAVFVRPTRGAMAEASLGWTANNVSAEVIAEADSRARSCNDTFF